MANPGGYDPLADRLKVCCLTTLLYARGPVTPFMILAHGFDLLFGVRWRNRTSHHSLIRRGPLPLGLSHVDWRVSSVITDGWVVRDPGFEPGSPRLRRSAFTRLAYRAAPGERSGLVGPRAFIWREVTRPVTTRVGTGQPRFPGETSNLDGPEGPSVSRRSSEVLHHPEL